VATDVTCQWPMPVGFPVGFPIRSLLKTKLDEPGNESYFMRVTVVSPIFGIAYSALNLFSIPCDELFLLTLVDGPEGWGDCNVTPIPWFKDANDVPHSPP